MPVDLDELKNQVDSLEGELVDVRDGLLNRIEDLDALVGDGIGEPDKRPLRERLRAIEAHLDRLVESVRPAVDPMTTATVVALDPAIISNNCPECGMPARVVEIAAGLWKQPGLYACGLGHQWRVAFTLEPE